MDEVDLGEAQHLPAYESTGSASDHSDDDFYSADDHPQQQTEPLSRRLRGSLSGLRHSIAAASSSADASSLKANGGYARDRLRTAMQRMRRKDMPQDNQNLSDEDDEGENNNDENGCGRRSMSQQLLSALSISGLTIIHEERLVLLGQSPLVQPQDDLLFLEPSSSSSSIISSQRTLQRGDYIRIQSPDDASQSWLCQVALDRVQIESDMISLAAPFPGPLVPDAIIHLVPRECLPLELTGENSIADMFSSESEDVSDLRSSVDAWRPSVDDLDDSPTDDELERDPRYSDSTTTANSSSTRTSAAREKASAFYEKYKTKKQRLRTSSSDYKEKLKQVSKDTLAVASQVSKQKLAVASQVSKEKLAAASVVSKEKLAVAGQASKEKLAVAGQASKLKMQSWTSSARSSLKAKMAQRSEQKATAAATATMPEDVFTTEDAEEAEEETKPAVDGIVNEEEKHLRQEMIEQC